MFDIDNSGTITIDEIKQILGNGGNDVDDHEWEQIVEEVDDDGNGEISFSEFKQMMYKVFKTKEVTPIILNT